ncbi:NAD(P)-dependent oxidoreductase [Acinetobacter sp. ANC 4558]|uniref:NAD-dependent epimerase/dehydratase family protein n=1 Tax=Acinetobacter sp. ANC 4558 TaxID=1977876 RepID=UPI000A337CCF|nr:NAD-dependent epimerase/dehydratase family protein [Acinetobacter sp. ANC 4558]OTG87994.1 NAD(P)-dependent oxidoreductase [Acinetobacter sp. ANC 4558]
MHILFIGYGKTSQRVAKQLFELGYQLTTISQTAKTDLYANHLIQNINQLNLTNIKPIDCVFILLAPNEGGIEAYQKTYLDSTQPIIKALKHHPLKKLIVVSSTRVYGENKGESIDDESMIQPIDEQGQILYEMENTYLKAFPQLCSIVRPTGIYGLSVQRMITLAEKTEIYPNIHWSNRIHIDDLARFLVHLLHVEHIKKTYICTNNRPIPLHEIVQWFQQQLNLPKLVLGNQPCSGKKIFAHRMIDSGFQLKHTDCYQDYLALLK